MMPYCSVWKQAKKRTRCSARNWWRKHLDIGTGTRGGPIPPLTIDQARRLFETWRSDDFGYIKRKILVTAFEYGQVHADDVSQDLEGSGASRNIIGAAFNSLRGSGLIQSTGEHRASRMPSTHNRRSYVYRLTGKGKEFARVLHVDREARFDLQPRPNVIYMQDQLEFDE